MHIPDGILPAEVAVAGYVVTGVATWASLQVINRAEDPEEGIPRAALLSSAFLVASWIHIPVPPTSVHLVLNGLLGVLLGYYAFPAIVVGLFFQAVLFQHGGLTTLGVNAAMMGLPALLAYHLFQLRYIIGSRWTGIFAFLGGAVGLGLAAFIAFTLLINFIPADIDADTEREAILSLTLAHGPLMLIEGAFAALVATYLERVKPALLGGVAHARVD